MYCEQHISEFNVRTSFKPWHSLFLFYDSQPVSQLAQIIFFFSLWGIYGPGVDSACKRNEYQEYFLGG
jgi:hypothetical protein